MQPMNCMNVEFLSISDNIAFARVVVAAFVAQLDITLNELDELKVAISEAVTNAIIHAYAGKKNGRIRIEAMLYEQAMEIIVEDTGLGIEDVEQAMQPDFSSKPDRMGLGFSFMQSFTDTLEVHSVPGQGTRVKMLKTLNTPAVAQQQKG